MKKCMEKVYEKKCMKKRLHRWQALVYFEEGVY